MLSKDNGDFAGYVTSSAFSIRAERAVAFAHLTRECTHEDPLFVGSTHEAWHVDAQAPVP
jgi:glycine cleavage system aminomethyltransferase T